MEETIFKILLTLSCFNQLFPYNAFYLKLINKKYNSSDKDNID